MKKLTAVLSLLQCPSSARSALKPKHCNPYLCLGLITLDGSTVGTTSQSHTTLSDGTFTFTMTPSSLGTVNIIYAGHVIGTIPVLSAYTQNTRIGGTTEDNVSLSVDIAKSGWTQGTRYVILARDDQFSEVS